MSAYRRDFKEAKYVSCLTKYDNFMNFTKNLQEHQEKIFDNEPLYDNKYLKINIKSYQEKINANFFL